MKRDSSINNQAALLLAGITTTGGGALAEQQRQQGVRTDAVGTTAGWSFLTDGTDGVLICDVESAPGSQGFLLANAQGGAIGYVTVASYISATQISVTVRDPADQSVVDLAATVVAVQAIGAIL